MDSTDSSKPETRKVGFPLGIGIFLIPIIFAWFTLRKGYSTSARIFSFGWLILGLVLFSGNFSSVSKLEKNSVSQDKQGVTAEFSQDGEKTDDSATEETPEKTEEAAEEKIFRTTASDLYKAYEENEVVADEQMKGKLVEVSGVIKSIDKDAFDNIIIRLKTGNQFASAALTLEDNQKQAAMKLKKGASVVIVCEKMSRLIGSPMGKDCVLKD